MVLTFIFFHRFFFVPSWPDCNNA